MDFIGCPCFPLLFIWAVLFCFWCRGLISSHPQEEKSQVLLGDCQANGPYVAGRPGNIWPACHIWTALRPSVLYSTVKYCTVQYRTVQYCTVLYSIVQYFTVLYSTVQYCTVLYSTAQYCTVLYRPVRFLPVPPVRLHHGSGSTGSVPLTGSTGSGSDRFEFQVPG